MAKANKIGLKWFKHVPVQINGRTLCFVSSTKPKLYLDSWLLTHPFYTQSKTFVDTYGPAQKFIKKYKL